MAVPYSPGDVEITAFYVVSPRFGTIDATANFLTGSVIESIYTPGIVAEFKVIDYLNSMATYQLTGDEQIYFAWTRPIGGSGSYLLQLDSVKDQTPEGALHSKIYNFVCISTEHMIAQGNYIQQAYNEPISDIVTTLMGMLNSILPVDVEATKGNRNIKIANQTIASPFEMLRKEAISTR